MKWHSILFVVGSLAASQLSGLQAKASPQNFQKEIEQTLSVSGENRLELVKALENVADAQAMGMRFLIAHMPEHDAKALSAEFLLSNVDLAYKARTAFPWAEKVPEDIFLNDVLPYAVLNERRDDWRGDFFKRFSKYVEGATTQIEAIKAVNNVILEELKVEYNTKRKKPDQSPYESMEIGMASCTGLSILLNDAFRAVGIPSRVVGIPMWTTKRGNHNWVEIWDAEKKQWRFTEYYPDQSGELDRGWLLGDAAKANPKSFYHSIYASSWKPTGQHFPLVWDMKRKDVHAVNVTERYVKLGGGGQEKDACELRIHYVKDGKRIAVPVAVVQGDVKLLEGDSPKPTDDMNRYLTAKAGKGQMYQIVWKDPATGEMKREQVTLPKDKDWLVIELK